MTMIEVSDRAHGPARMARELVGRDRELSVIGAFLDELPVGAGALLLSGEVGTGKSALLDAAEEAAAAAGIRVLRAAGAEFEDINFCGLNQLLLPLSGELNRLGRPQLEALNAALGFSDGPTGDWLLVMNAALALLRQAAADSPLLLIVDDLQWVDRASALVLGFVARRLGGSRVGLIAAERTGTSRRVLDIPGYEVRPLDDDASVRLVSVRFPDLVPAVRQRIVAEAQGNSLALLELPAGISAYQRSGVVPLPAVLPLSGRLQELVSSRLAAMPAATGYVLLTVPEGTGSVSLLGTTGAHKYGVDDFARGPSPRRLAVAAYHAASVSGDLGAAEALLADARRACSDQILTAESALASAFVLLHGDGDITAAHRLLLRGLETARDGGTGPLSADEALSGLVTVCQLSGDAERWGSLERAITESGSAFTPNARTAALIALDPKYAPARSDGLVGPDAWAAEPDDIVRTANASLLSNGSLDCRQALLLAARPDPDGSIGTSAMQAGILLALEAYQTGQWDEAWRQGQTTAAACARRGYQLLRRKAQAVQAFVAASRGDTRAAQGLADDIVGWAEPRGIRSLLADAHFAYAQLALAQSDFQTAYHQAASISPPGGIPRREHLAAWSVLDFVEAALRTDRPADAISHVQAVRRSGLAATSPRMALLSAAARGMIASDAEAPDLFDLALASEDAGRWPFDRARVHLLYGERLRRARAVTQARAHLGTALDEFRRLGAPTWANRAAIELRAAGLAAKSTDRYDQRLLTPQQLEIARLAAEGLSNQQIADRLFLSRRTVASHLYRMFPKLGITSRAALGRVLARGED